jgi:hypothetical protein
MPDTRTIALDLIRQGLHVFPLQSRKKVTMANCDRCYPKTAPCRDSDTPCPCWPSEPCHGFRAATGDRGVADRWWWRWPRANVGIYPWPSGHLVLDLDVKPVPVPAALLPAALGLGTLRATSGVDLFAQVMRHLGGGDRLDTRITRTPTGGLHVWFTAPPGVLIGSSQGRAYPDGRVTGLGWQIDVRAQGGYVVAPGSVTTHGSYRLLRDLSPMPVPDWLAWWLHHTTIDVTTRPDCGQDRPSGQAAGPQARGTAGTAQSRAHRYAASALADECRDLAAMAPQSGRNSALNQAAYKLGGYVPDGHLTEQDVIAALTDAARTCGLRDREIHRAIRSGLSAGMKRSRHLGLTA